MAEYSPLTTDRTFGVAGRLPRGDSGFPITHDDCDVGDPHHGACTHALVSVFVKSKRKRKSRSASRLDGANFQPWAASVASRAKYLLGPGKSTSEPMTL